MLPLLGVRTCKSTIETITIKPTVAIDVDGKGIRQLNVARCIL